LIIQPITDANKQSKTSDTLAGIGVFMLVALTVERYMAVCRLGRTRTFAAQKTPLVALALAVAAISLYLPYLFRANLLTCTDTDGHLTYRKRENPAFVQSNVWAAYLWILEVIFKVAPIFLIITFAAISSIIQTTGTKFK
jgi:hypothetical protein